MKKVLLALVLGLAALPSFATQYISQCAMSYGDTADEAKQKLIDAGYTPIGGDLNETAGGKYVLIGATYTTDPNQAITGFAVYNSDLSGAEDRPNTFSRGGVTYYKIGSGCVDWCPNVADGAVDLTMGARGDDMNMYATRDLHAGPPVTDWCQACKSKSDDAKKIINDGGFTPVYDQKGNWADCNEDTCDWYIYVGYKMVRSDDCRYPEYRTAGTPTSGIKEWKTGSAAAAPIRNNETTWNAGWHVVECNLTISSRITCNGDVRLILADGCKLTAAEGVTVSGGNSLTIYGQTAGTGALVAYGPENAAGIGGLEGQAGQNITINGGTVTATGGGWGAGIGGGRGGAGKDITINGGAVTATGGDWGAGIGGGISGAGQNIMINGGEVTATGGLDSAGIGGGAGRGCECIRLNAGTVKATGGWWGAGIGGGRGGAGKDITINGGIVTATGGSAAGIGGGKDGSASNVKVDPSALIVKANGSVVANDGSDLSAKLKDKWSVVIAPSTVSVGDGVTATFAAGVCTISGEGAMSEHAPLMGDDSTDGMLELCRNDIRSLVIGNGVTSVAPERFNAFPALANVTIAASVTRIGAGAFANCSALESITFLGDTLPTIEEGALDVRVSIELVDGIPVVSSTPYVTVGERAPRLMGAKSLANPIRWEQVEAGKESEYKFFRVEIE